MPEKILIVDDEESILSALSRLFRREDFEIVTANSAEKGLSILENEEISLIISDNRMPAISGVEFLARSKGIAPDAVRIMLTGYADLEASIDAINKGEVYRFITKPWNDGELKVIVRQSLEVRNLKKHNKSLTNMVQKQSQILMGLEDKFPGISQVSRTDDGIIKIADNEEDDIETLLASFNE